MRPGENFEDDMKSKTSFHSNNTAAGCPSMRGIMMHMMFGDHIAVVTSLFAIQTD